MREPADEIKPGHEVASSLTWRADDPIQPGARVEATDGPLGVVRERRTGEGPEYAYLGVETDQGLVYLPDRLIRETHGDTVMLSLPRAECLAQRGPMRTSAEPGQRAPQPD